MLNSPQIPQKPPSSSPPKFSSPSPIRQSQERHPDEQRIPIVSSPVPDKLSARGAVSPVPDKMRSPGPVEVNGRNSPATFASGQMSPTPAMLKNQMENLRPKREEESINIPVRNQINPSYDRRNSCTAAENIRSRILPKTKTPTFGELQFRYGKDYKSPSPAPILDKDYQKNARQTVVGELSRYSFFLKIGLFYVLFVVLGEITRHLGFLEGRNRVSHPA